jgi:hypothetical protein
MALCTPSPNWAIETDALVVRSLRSQARGRRSFLRYASN